MKKKTAIKPEFCFVLNPISGNGRNKKYCADIIREVRAMSPAEVRTVELQRQGHAREVATHNYDNDHCTLVAVGGDGTVNEIASSLIYSNITMAIVPRGSGNGLAKAIKVPDLKKQIADYLVGGKAKKIDAGKVGNRHFFCTGGFGFDAHIAAAFNAGKGRGFQRYVQNIAKELLAYKPVRAEFSLDGKEYKGEYFLVTFANANQYGNNAYIAPHADISDGYLQCVIWHPFPPMLAPMLATALLGGFIDKMPFIETVRFKKAEIHSVSSELFHCDGESFTVSYPTEVEVIENAVKMLVPKGYRRKLPLNKTNLLKSLSQFTQTDFIRLLNSAGMGKI